MKYDSEADTRKHIARVGKYLGDVIHKLLFRQTQHDESKLSKEEKPTFDKFTNKLAKSTYNSPKYKQFLIDMQPALEHHYKTNRHHPEHFLDSTGIGFTSGLHDMNLIDIIEMLCDWKAATERHNNGDIYVSIEKNQDRFGYNDELKSILINTAKYLNM